MLWKTKYLLHSAFSSEIVLSIVKNPAAPKFTSILVSHQLKEGNGSRCQTSFQRPPCMVACLAATPRPSSVSSPSTRMFICGFSGEYREYQKHEREAKEAKAKEAKEASVDIWWFVSFNRMSCLVFVVVYYRPGPGQLFNWHILQPLELVQNSISSANKYTSCHKGQPGPFA